MGRSSRLILLMDAMRGRRVPVTAAQLARQLGVSKRTVYRDIQTLAELGAPPQGEAGVAAAAGAVCNIAAWEARMRRLPAWRETETRL